MIGYDSNRGGVSVVTEKGIESSSSLLIQNARPTDSGKYVCRPDNAEPATVNVHVLNGKPLCPFIFFGGGGRGQKNIELVFSFLSTKRHTQTHTSAPVVIHWA